MLAATRRLLELLSCRRGFCVTNEGWKWFVPRFRGRKYMLFRGVKTGKAINTSAAAHADATGLHAMVSGSSRDFALVGLRMGEERGCLLDS